MPEIFKKTDSIEAKFSRAALLNNRASTGTKVRMQTTFKILCKVAKAGRWGQLDPGNLTAKQLKKFVQIRLEKGVSARSLQNEMSHIRRALRGVGRDQFGQETCSNKAVGIPSSTRIGTGLIVDPRVLKYALENAPPNIKVLIQLCRALGLRKREALQSFKSLKEWNRALAAGQPIIIRDGTKGGRMRSVFITPDGVEAAKEAVRGALAVLKYQKYLVLSNSLKNALATLSRCLKHLGLSGDNSCHSLRRSFALDQFEYYLAQGCDQKTALQRVSSDLGHGDGRGRWVFNNYLRASLEKGLYGIPRTTDTLIGCAATLFVPGEINSRDGVAVLAVAFSAGSTAVRCTSG